MERYEKYKDSGVQWLGEIPSHWEVMKTSFVFNNIGSGTTPKSGQNDYYCINGIPFLQTGDLNDSVVSITTKSITAKAQRELNLKIYPEGSLVIAMYGATIGKLGILGLNSTVNQACCVLPISDKLQTKYASYAFMSAKRDLILQSNGGGQPNISQDTIKKQKLPVPPIEEQAVIVSYLDSVTAKIDEAIAQQQKMIDLLNERKQIIIQNAVTKGLDPDVKMKVSGVEWIGEIPEGWEVLPFKRVSEIILGKMLKNGPESKSYPYFCARDVHMLSINYDDLKKMVFSPIERKMYAVRRGDMLVVEGGASGSSAIIKRDIKDVYIQNSIMIVRGRENVVINDYMCYFLNAIVNRGYSECVCNKATIMHFTKDKLSNTLLPIPPIKEQSAIISYLDDESGKFNTVIETCQKKISLLRERKQIIINDVVTGKVKVS